MAPFLLPAERWLPLFVRVKDPSTRHEFDVPEDDWRLSAGLYQLVKSDRYPPADRPRLPKHSAPLRAEKKETENG